MKWSPRLLKWVLNLYPPYFGAGIRINEISADWHRMRVTMKLRWYNRNAVGTHFGGSLYSMADPHLMLMLMQILGKEFIVWDHSAAIRFKQPGEGRVEALFKIEEKDIETIRQNTLNGKKYLPEFSIQIIDEQKQVVAEIKKTIYIRRKQTNLITMH